MPDVLVLITEFTDTYMARCVARRPPMRDAIQSKKEGLSDAKPIYDCCTGPSASAPFMGMTRDLRTPLSDKGASKMICPNPVDG